MITDIHRKEIVRQVIECVIVDIEGTSEQVHYGIKWINRRHAEGAVIRPMAS